MNDNMFVVVSKKNPLKNSKEKRLTSQDKYDSMFKSVSLRRQNKLVFEN